MNNGIFPASKMGFGCMRLPKLGEGEDAPIDIPQFKDMVDAFMEAGNTYFDTAYVYGDGASERALNEALVKRYPRDSFTLATKCFGAKQPDAASARACLDISLERLGTDYVDYYLLHNLGGTRTAKYDEYGLWDYFAQKREEGVIRYFGFSLHDTADALEEILNAHPQVDFVQVQVNYLDWENPVVQSRRLMEVAAAHGKPVVIMEPARGGRLCSLPERVASILREVDEDATQASWAYRFCWEKPGVLAVLSGMSTIQQARENVAGYQAFVPFSPDERAALGRAAAELANMAQIPCTNCRYCVEGCPAHVKIPETLNLLNLESMIEDSAFARGQYGWQTAEGRASACLECGTCEATCPQSIGIIDWLKVAVRHFED